MGSESYTLREVAELLGVSKRTLQRRIQEGVFPGRFLAPGRHGLETRVPAGEVERVLEDMRRGRAGDGWTGSRETGRDGRWGGRGEVRLPTLSAVGSEGQTGLPAVAETAEVSISGGPQSGGITQSDLVSMRDAMLAIVREDRERFLAVVREAMLARERDVAAVRAQVTTLGNAVQGIRRALERGGIGERSSGQASGGQGDREAGAPVDVDGVLEEIEAIEALLRPRGSGAT